MIFPQYQYDNYSLYESKTLPDSWNNMVNGAVNYCDNFDKFKWNEFCFYYYKGKFVPSDLPSFHPYWSAVASFKRREDLDKLINKYEECRRDPDKLVYYFSQDMTLTLVKRMIIEKEQNLLKEYDEI